MRAGKKVVETPAHPVPVPRRATAPARSSEGEFLTWHPMPSVVTSCPAPPPKQGHVAEVIGGHMYVFGGLESGRRTNTLHAMDLGTRQWQTVPPKGDLPCGRSFAASWIWDGHLIVHGGETDSFTLPGPDQPSHSALNDGRRRSSAACDRDGTNDVGRVCADDVFAFSPAIGKWSRVNARLGPTPRRGHSVCVARVQGEEAALLFGGMQAGRRGASNEVYLLPLDNRLFAGRAVWTKGLVKGTPPTPRYGHTATVVSASSLIVYGGRAGSGELLSDIYILDLDSLYWTHVAKVIGRPPPARYGHRACELTPPPSLLRQSRSHNTASVWSGTPMASARSPRSQGSRVVEVAAPSQAGHMPMPSHGGLPTANHTVGGDTNAPSAAGTASARVPSPACLLVFGGAMQAGKGSKSRTIFSHELYMFDATRYQWSEVAVGHAMPNSRFGHSLAVVKELPPTRFYSDGRPVDKDKEDTVTISQQDHPCKVFALVFGGINAVYCNADTWMLELQWRTRAMAGTTYVNTLKTHCPRLKEPDDFDDGGPVAQAALRKARIECSIAEREHIRESRQRIAIQKRYDDLEAYCAALQGQMRDVQSQSGDRARELQAALESERGRARELRTLNDEAFELMALQELRIALSWGSSDGAAALLLQANPDVKSAMGVAAQRSSHLLAEHRSQAPGSVAASEQKASPQRGEGPHDGASVATDSSKKPVSALASLASHRGLQVKIDPPLTPTPHTISMSPSPKAFNFVPLKHEPPTTTTAEGSSSNSPILPRVSFFSSPPEAALPPPAESSTDSSWGASGDTLPTPITLSLSPKDEAKRPQPGFQKPPGTPMRESQQAPSPSPPPDVEGLWGETAPLVDESSLPRQISFKLNKAPPADAQESAPSPSEMVDFFEKFKAARAKEGLPPL